MRLKRGLDLEEMKTRYGEKYEKKILEKSVFLRENGLIKLENNIISLTEKGFLVSNSVIAELI